MHYFDFPEVARLAVHQRINLAVQVTMSMYLFLTMVRMNIDPHLRCLPARMTRIA